MTGSPFKVLFEDNHLLVVEKPVNLPVQADSSGDPDLLTLLKQDLKARYQKPGNVFLGLVHRLDRPVGGVMVFARTSKAAARLAEQIRNHTFQKTYWAVVHGIPRETSAALRHFLKKDSAANMVATVSANAPGAQEARLTYQTLASMAQLSFIEVRLETGRSHQIRVQLAAIGHPLYGDQKYGPEINRPGQQLALWSHQIGFLHPTLHDPLTFASIPPATGEPWSHFQQPFNE